MYTLGNKECKGQAYTIIQIPHKRGTRESNKQLPKVPAANWSSFYHSEGHTGRLYSTHLL